MDAKDPLGWEINLLFLMSHCNTLLAEDIDMQIKNRTKGRDRFDPVKKRCIYNYEKSIKEAEEWMFKFGLDKITYEAVDNHNKRYSNVISNANLLIRMMMLCLDRSHCDNGDARVFKRLRSLPENGIFDEKAINRFQMKLEIVPEKGDHVMTDNHGEGILDLHLGNENWQVTLVDGSHVILNEKNFKLM